ncbi:hypothetical protein [Erythrobacter tepidarius]|uniref:hypothetical protein n=1 Tax=Erythrobacter tepidarius TaxID=60454 RepID=UPI00117C2A4D|nr:hypothetical protein [Erythrobacter tepidarius]
MAEDDGKSVFSELEHRLKPNRQGALRKIGDRILALEQLRLWFVIVAGFGAALAALARAFPGDAGLVLVCVGAALALVGGVFVARFDFRKLELTAFLNEAESIAEDAIKEGRHLEARQSAAEALDTRRLALLDANRVMRETLEQALLFDDADLISTLELMVDTSLSHLLVSVGFSQEEAWVLSIFQVQGDELVRVVARRAKRADEKKESRRWKKNEGIVGAAWARENVVIVADGQDDLTADELKVPTGLQHPDDKERYRSMGAVPIRLGDPAEIWGVVAFSSDRAGRFKRAPNDRQEQAVDTVRLVAHMTALVAATFRRIKG